MDSATRQSVYGLTADEDRYQNDAAIFKSGHALISRLMIDHHPQKSLLFLGDPDILLIQEMKSLGNHDRWIPLTYDIFSDDEIRPHIHGDLHHRDVVFIFSWSRLSFGTQTMKLLWTLDALHRQHPRSLHLCVPYMPWGRTELLEGLHALARWLHPLRLTSLRWCDGHQSSMKNVFSGYADSFSVAPLWVEDLKSITEVLRQPVIVAPDQGGAARAYGVAEALGWPCIALHKERTAHALTLRYDGPLMLEKRDVVIIDDIIDSGNTLQHATDLLRSQGAASVRAYITHGVLSQGLPVLKNLTQLTVSNTLPIPQIPPSQVLRHISIAPFLKNELQRMHQSAR